MNYSSRPSRSWTVLQATQQSPTLARLAELAADSTARLRCVAPLLPAALRKSVKAGAIDDAVWCLVVDNNAVASGTRAKVNVDVDPWIYMVGLGYKF